jgi:hypothetical protein
MRRKNRSRLSVILLLIGSHLLTLPYGAGQPGHAARKQANLRGQPLGHLRIDPEFPA